MFSTEINMNKIRSKLINDITFKSGVHENAKKMLEEYEENDTVDNKKKIINELVTGIYICTADHKKAEELFDQYDKLRATLIKIQLIDDIAWKYVLIAKAQYNLHMDIYQRDYIDKAINIVKIYEDNDSRENSKMILKELSDKYKLEGKENHHILAVVQFYRYKRIRKLL